MPPVSFATRPDSTDSAIPLETEEIVFSISALGLVVTAPDRAAAPLSELFGLPRVPGQPRVVEFHDRPAPSIVKATFETVDPCRRSRGSHATAQTRIRESSANRGFGSEDSPQNVLVPAGDDA